MILIKLQSIITRSNISSFALALIIFIFKQLNVGRLTLLSRRTRRAAISARLTAHLRHVLDLAGQVLIEDYLVEDGPKTHALLTNDLNQPRTSLLTGRILAHLLLEELQSPLVHVITETSHASMPEQLDFVVEFDDLRVLFLAKLIAVLLIHVELLAILVVVFIVIVVLVKEGIVIIFLTIEVWSLHQVLIILP